MVEKLEGKGADCLALLWVAVGDARVRRRRITGSCRTALDLVHLSQRTTLWTHFW